jgi:hypothetical protein
VITRALTSSSQGRPRQPWFQFLKGSNQNLCMNTGAQSKHVLLCNPCVLSESEDPATFGKLRVIRIKSEFGSNRVLTRAVNRKRRVHGPSYGYETRP